MSVFNKAISAVEKSSTDSLKKALEVVGIVFVSCPHVMKNIDLEKFGQIIANTLVNNVEDPFVCILVEELVNHVAMNKHITTSSYSGFSELFCIHFIDWIDVNETDRLDIALEFIAGFVMRLDGQFGPNIRACIEKISLLRDDLVVIGPVTEETVVSILAHS